MSSTQRATQFDAYQPGPHPMLSPEEVVLLQLRALKANDADDRGIGLAFRFASPENQAYVGPLERFVRLLHEPAYSPMLNHLTEELGPARVDGHSATLRVTVLGRDRQRYAYCYYLSRQEQGALEGCWLVDGVAREPEPLPAVSPDEARRADRLELLFAELRRPQMPQQQQLIEDEIWALWLHHDAPELSAGMQRGLEALAERDYDGARDHFSALLTQDPDYIEAWNKRATTHYLRGDFKRALDDVEQVLLREPRHFGALAGQGTIYLEIGMPRAALRSFERLRRVMPYAPTVIDRIDQLKQRLGD